MTQTGMVAGGCLTDWISLGVLASWVPRDAVDEAIEATGKGAKRPGGKLPPHVMVYFVMALALFADEDYEEVAARLTETLRTGAAGISPGQVPTSGGITQARQRLGSRAGERAVRAGRGPGRGRGHAGGVPGAVAADEHRRVRVGRPGHGARTSPRSGFPAPVRTAAKAAFPKARVVTIGECASHAAVVAAIGPVSSKGSGEQSLARSCTRGWRRTGC